VIVPLFLATTCVQALTPRAVYRPVLSGAELAHDTADGRFKIHYTLDGADRILDSVDADPVNGVPDTLDWVEAGATRMVNVFVGEDGWPMATTDEGEGGDDRLDIYLKKIDANGYAYVQRLVSGNYASYIELHPGKISFGRASFESIAGHEVHHTLQFAVGLGIDSWILEAGATYAQYLVNPPDRLFSLALEALWQFRLSESDQPLETLGRTFEYAGLVWVKFLMDHGTRTDLLTLFQSMVTAGGWVEGHDLFLPSVNLVDLDEAVTQFHTWNVFSCTNSDGHHYDPATIPCTFREAQVPVTAGPESPLIGLRGAAYGELLPDCSSDSLAVTLSSASTMRVEVIGVATAGESQVTRVDLEPGVPQTVTVPSWNHLRRVVLAGTNLSSVTPVSFGWTTSASGSYTPPASPQPPRSLAFTPLAASMLPVGARVPLSVSGDPQTCEAARDVTSQVTFRVSNPTILAVEGTDLVALAPGFANVVAVSGDVESAPLRVEVLLPPAPADAGGCAVAHSGEASVAAPLLLLILALLVRRRPHCCNVLRSSSTTGGT
jgi:MYXO-CTERM domain-containing protein